MVSFSFLVIYPLLRGPLFVPVKRSSRTLVGPGNLKFFRFQGFPPSSATQSLFFFFEVPYSRDRWQPVFAHSVLLFALLLACRTTGTPVPCKAGLYWTPRMGGSATTGSYDTRPRAPGNPVSPLFPVVRNIAVHCLFVTPVQVARTRRFTHRTHVLFLFFFFPIPGLLVCSLMGTPKPSRPGSCSSVPLVRLVLPHSCYTQ